MVDEASEAVDLATRLIRQGAAALVGLVPEEPAFQLYGPGFAVTISRTDPAAYYPGKPHHD